LGDCLASIRGLVAEIVVVDTGSTDGTTDIARRHGARVFHHEWTDDFAAARNHAIAQANGDWLLYIDADERARPCDRDALHADLAAPDLLGATVAFRPRTGFTAYPELRLIRRDPRIRFHGAMHETFWPDIERLRREGAGTTGASRLALDHIGYDGDQSHKFDRNLRLLTKQIAADPTRSYLYWHLGTVHLAMGRPDAAEAAWSEGMRLVRARSYPLPDDAQCFVETIKLRWSRGQDVAGLLDEAESIQPGNWLLLWLRAKIFVAAGEHEAAIDLFERLAAVDADTLVDAVAYDSRIFGAWACAEIGHIAFQHGQFARSQSWYGRAERLQPSNPEFRVKRMLAHARRGT